MVVGVLGSPSHRWELLFIFIVFSYCSSILTSKKTRTTKHPLDNTTVIIFIIGGITAEESKRLHRSVITSGVDNTVIFGSTRLVTPAEAMRDVLAL